MSLVFSLISLYMLLGQAHLLCLNKLLYARNSLYLSLVHAFVQCSTGSPCLDVSHVPHYGHPPISALFQSSLALWIVLLSSQSPKSRVRMEFLFCWFSCHFRPLYLMGRKRSSRIIPKSWSEGINIRKKEVWLQCWYNTLRNTRIQDCSPRMETELGFASFCQRQLESHWS